MWAMAFLLMSAAAAPYATPPDWEVMPTENQLQSVWPRLAREHGVGGVVELDCLVNVAGRLEDCRVTRENPPGVEFGAAALRLTPKLRFRPARNAAGPVAARIHIPINFETTSPGPSSTWTGTLRMVDTPLWVTSPSAAELLGVYPRQARGASGNVAFECWVMRDGSLTRCDVIREEPPNQGFARAGYAVLGKFRLKMEPADEGPHVALRVTVPIRFDPPADPGAASAKR
jgi:TonB family protein